ncbi:MAG TPA: hypothetical protein VLA17_02440 [Candidatus Limnocylindria bacterium]|nr:hypothetical protein [Candidatus Limnocylindria bacterium]
MKIKSFPLACVLTIFLTTVALGGDMPGPGAPSKPPKEETAMTMPAICEPLEPLGGEVSAGAACQEATPSIGFDAIIFAIRILLPLY